MADKRIFRLHIGWPKTGTTTLQKHVWPKLPGHRYLGTTPFEGEKNGHTFRLVHLLAYASREKFQRDKLDVLDELEVLEADLYGTVDKNIPLLLSEEGVLSSLLKPTTHWHHGYSTASLEQIIERLLDLEQAWGVQFDLFVTEREPIDLLHAYYAQVFHHIRQIRGLGSFQGYIRRGTGYDPRGDLGFHYLQPRYVLERLNKAFGSHQVHVIAMNELLDGSTIHLSKWHSDLEDFRLASAMKENSRSRGSNVKITHLRPLWEPKKPFRLMPFLRKTWGEYRKEHLDHSKLEVEVRMNEEDQQILAAYFSHERTSE